MGEEAGGREGLKELCSFQMLYVPDVRAGMLSPASSSIIALVFYSVLISNNLKR